MVKSSFVRTPQTQKDRILLDLILSMLNPVVSGTFLRLLSSCVRSSRFKVGFVDLRCGLLLDCGDVVVGFFVHKLLGNFGHALSFVSCND